MTFELYEEFLRAMGKELSHLVEAGLWGILKLRGKASSVSAWKIVLSTSSLSLQLAFPYPGEYFYTKYLWKFFTTMKPKTAMILFLGICFGRRPEVSHCDAMYPLDEIPNQTNNSTSILCPLSLPFRHYILIFHLNISNPSIMWKWSSALSCSRISYLVHSSYLNCKGILSIWLIAQRFSFRSIH